MGSYLYCQCPDCKETNLKVNNCCIYCGAPLHKEPMSKGIFSTTFIPGRKNCHDCQVANPSVAKFCCFCGHKFEEKEVAPENQLKVEK